MSPDRRRRAVQVLQQRFGVSERRACRVVGQHRSAQRRPARPPREADEVLRARLRQISVAHPRWGWRKAHAIAAREGPLLPCRLCRQPALMRDEHGRPCHKVCAEQITSTPPATKDRDALVVDLAGRARPAVETNTSGASAALFDLTTRRRIA